MDMFFKTLLRNAFIDSHNLRIYLELTFRLRMAKEMGIW